MWSFLLFLGKFSMRVLQEVSRMAGVHWYEQNIGLVTMINYIVPISWYWYIPRSQLRVSVLTVSDKGIEWPGILNFALQDCVTNRNKGQIAWNIYLIWLIWLILKKCHSPVLVEWPIPDWNMSTRYCTRIMIMWITFLSCTSPLASSTTPAGSRKKITCDRMPKFQK